MHITLGHVTRVYATGEHAAFTDLCRWRGQYYLAFRRAYGHGITPPGDIAILRWDGTQPTRPRWLPCATLHHPQGDCRDPKFYATDEALYCLCGVYLSMPGRMIATLDDMATQNVLMTHVTFTTDGEHWAPLRPVLRPNYWGWSCVALPLSSRRTSAVVVASYHVGTPGETTSSIALSLGVTPLLLAAHASIYDGASYARDGTQYAYAHSIPAEPVLYRPAPGVLACCLRTERSMEIGVSHAPYQSQWRWWDTQELIHPSAMLATPHGWLLAGRHCTPQYDMSAQAIKDRALIRRTRPDVEIPPLRYDLSTALWHIEAQQVTRLLTLPSGGDTGYAGLCHGEEPGEVLISWYSQHAYMSKGATSTLLPSSDVYVATIHVKA